MHLAGLSPFGPIFGKELRTASRRRRNYFLRVVYLGTLLLFLLFAYSITRDSWIGTNRSLRAQQQEQLGWLFFMFFSMFCVIAMGLIGPVLTSTAINEERLRRTLHVLLMTPLTAWQIVSGKLFSRLLTALTLIGLSLPVLALVRLLGGVELQQMFGVICLSAVTALTSAALGLLLSVVLRRAYAVIILAYLLMAFVYFFIPMMAIAFAINFGSGRGTLMGQLSDFNPFWCTAMLAGGSFRAVSISWVPCVIGHLVATALLTVTSALLLRREARREGEAASPLPPAPLTDAPFTDAPPPLPVQKAQRTVSDDPVLWRELRRPLMSRRWQRVAGTAAALLLLGITYIVAGLNDALHEEEAQVPYAFLFQTGAMLFCCVISATAIAQEKEGDTWTVLLATPLSGMEIVWGKAIGTARRLLWPMMLVVAHFLAFTVTGVLRPQLFILIVATIVGFNVIWLATGVYLSLRCRRVTVAVILNLALPVMLYVIFSIVLAVLDELLNINGHLIEKVMWYLPYYYLVAPFDGARRGDIRLPNGSHVPLIAFLAIALTAVIVHVGAAMAILGWTARRFDKIVGRAPQADPLGLRSLRRPDKPPTFAAIEG
jgi:ABC-type transport system involved in multi-copper enzyme maturation permease subunit